MKATGIVRKVDELGRIVIPKELRETMEMHEEAPIEIFVDDESIILKKYKPGCTFCGSVEDVAEYKGRNICGECSEELEKLSKS